MSEKTDEFVNRFCIHYWLSNGSHSIDAVLQNRCEYEYIGILKEIAKSLNVDVHIETSPFEEGGLKRWFEIVVKKEDRNAAITAGVVLAFVSALIATPIGKISEIVLDKLFEDKQLTSLQKEKIMLEVYHLKNVLKKDSAELLQNNIIRKKKSNFYDHAIKEQNLYQVSYVIADNRFKPALNEIVIERSEFSKFILATDDLEPEFIENAKIEIIAPVLKKGKYKWLGLYGDSPISFSMRSAEFRQLVQNGDVEFKNGSVISCLLQIRKKIDSDGMEQITGYDVIRVDSYSENNEQKETREGKLNKIIRKENKLQVSMLNELN